MRIAEIETSAYRVPLLEPWGDQTHRVTHIDLIVTQVVADNGRIGTGFSYTVGVGVKAIESLLDWDIAPKLIGTNVAPRALWDQMWTEVHDAGGGGISTMALAAIDIAVWDLLSKERGISLVEMLGQFRAEVPCYGSGVNLNLPLAELEEQVAGWLQKGYRGVKVKVGKPDLEEDVERIDAIRRLLGPHRYLMVDANQGWDLATACRAIKALRKYDLYWVEEPLLSDDVLGHSRLRSLIDVPIALGENVYTKFQFRDYLVHKACDFVQADVVRVGGITPYLEIASLAEAWGVRMAPHFLAEISGQILCCIANAIILEDVEGGSFRELRILAEDVGVTDGRFTPPHGPGHGIVFDRAALDEYRLSDDPPRVADRLWRARED